MNKIQKNKFYTGNPGTSIVKNDFNTIEWGREANASWVIGKSSNPVFFTADGHNARIEDSARGSSVIITDKTLKTDLDLSNAHLWAIGNTINEHSCKIWTPTSCPKDYKLKHWNNQSIIKLLPLQFARERRSDNKLVSHSPFCFYYRRHTSFNPSNFLLEETIWQDESKDGNLLAVLKMAIVLGYREIFLFSNITQDSKAYKCLKTVAKLMIDNDIKVYNCNDLSIFPKADISEAYSACILN